MKIPERIQLGNLTYTITASKPAFDAACRAESTDLYGRTDHGTLEITLDPATAPAKQREVLLHEALHCCTERAGITADLGPQQEEKIVDRLTPQLLDLLRTNPRLLAYLTAP